MSKKLLGREDEIVELYLSGMTLETIAKSVGIDASYNTVRRVLLEKKVELRPRNGPHHANWRGGTKMGNGYKYVYITNDEDEQFRSMCTNNHYVAENRLVMARYLGRALTENETVHHINGNITDNRIENLQLRIGHHGPGQVAECGNCGSCNIIFKEISE